MSTTLVVSIIGFSIMVIERLFYWTHRVYMSKCNTCCEIDCLPPDRANSDAAPAPPPNLDVILNHIPNHE